jgi:hypothetical protein
MTLLTQQSLAADTYRPLSVKEIKANFTGMEFTDDVHWAYVFNRDGTILSYSMGRNGKGRWWTEQGGLCLEEGAEQRCYRVWTEGDKVQLRPIGVHAPLEGVIMKPRKRDS